MLLSHQIGSDDDLPITRDACSPCDAIPDTATPTDAAVIDFPVTRALFDRDTETWFFDVPDKKARTRTKAKKPAPKKTDAPRWLLRRPNKPDVSIADHTRKQGVRPSDACAALRRAFGVGPRAITLAEWNQAMKGRK